MYQKPEWRLLSNVVVDVFLSFDFSYWLVSRTQVQTVADYGMVMTAHFTSHSQQTLHLLLLSLLISMLLHCHLFLTFFFLLTIGSEFSVLAYCLSVFAVRRCLLCLWEDKWHLCFPFLFFPPPFFCSLVLSA